MTQQTQTQNEVLTVKEVAGILRLSERTVWKRIKDGTIPHIYIGGAVRVSREKLMAWLDGDN